MMINALVLYFARWLFPCGRYDVGTMGNAVRCEIRFVGWLLPCKKNESEIPFMINYSLNTCMPFSLVSINFLCLYDTFNLSFLCSYLCVSHLTYYCYSYIFTLFVTITPTVLLELLLLHILFEFISLLIIFPYMIYASICYVIFLLDVLTCYRPSLTTCLHFLYDFTCFKPSLST